MVELSKDQDNYCLEEILILLQTKSDYIELLNFYCAEIAAIETTNEGKYALMQKRGLTLDKVLKKYVVNKDLNLISSELERFRSIREILAEIYEIENSILSLDFSCGDVITFIRPTLERSAKIIHKCPFCGKIIAPREREVEFRPWLQNHSAHEKRGTIIHTIYTDEHCAYLLPENIQELEILHKISVGYFNNDENRGELRRYEEVGDFTTEIYHRFKNQIIEMFWFNQFKPKKQILKEIDQIKKQTLRLKK